MNIKQGLPYQIVSHRMKKYAEHYNISPEKCVIVPLKIFGDEASCDIRWEEESGESCLLENKFFTCDNLIPLNALQEFELHGLWKQYYGSGGRDHPKSQPDPYHTDLNFFQS